MSEKQPNTAVFYRLRDTIRKRIFSGLNEEQFRAAETGQGPVLCLAGAGSGKTMAMVYRILHLYIFGPQYDPKPKLDREPTPAELEQLENWLEENKDNVTKRLPATLLRLIRQDGVSPYSILAITFTNKAAEEMQERLEPMLGSAARDIWVMTFHKACVRILRREIKALGYSSDFTIYDDQDHMQLIKKTVAALDLDDKKYPPRAVSSMISRLKSELKDPASAKKQILDLWEEKVVQVYEIYQRELKKNNALDFDDLIMLTVQLFIKEPDILEYYRKRFQYVLVDEYQDTNHAQYRLISLLAGDHQNIFVVGDDDQSIYGFRQADIRNILDFERDFPGAKIIKLECNYRSTGRILAAANSVISQNLGRKKKTLWTNNPEGERLISYSAQDEQDEARFIGEQITELKQKGENYQDCAVLLRTNAQTRTLEEAFMKAGIPYRIVGGQKFYERMEIKDIMAYLKLLANQADGLSLRRIVNVPRRGIGEATMQKIEQLASLNNCSLFEALRCYASNEIGSKAAKGMLDFILLIERLLEVKEDFSITGLTEKIYAETRYVEILQKENTIEAESRLENLKELLTVTQEYDANNEEKSLSDFLSQVSLVSDLDSYEDVVEAVVIMTMHMAKGLEFGNVFLAGMEEGIFPHSRSVGDGELEEERRLFYVALTRAKKRVYLINARQRNLFGRRSYNQPSRFLEEVPLELAEEFKRKGIFETTYQGKGKNKQDIFRKGFYVLGEKVEHKKWGLGVIVSIRGEDEDCELQIAFPGMGIKTFLARYAPLQKIN